MEACDAGDGLKLLGREGLLRWLDQKLLRWRSRGGARAAGLLEVRGFCLPCCWEIIGVCSLLKVSDLHKRRNMEIGLDI
ncbi:hypothetical protein Taro_033906 [Colocasia esculenta]|uniref:Uncharacterized protein n=1 Tax=Colocasia esculenta TaxID=4460 RepID=A0A843W2P6_COLES|nr:hypothetical protein [Colocasia esculenta]